MMAMRGLTMLLVLSAIPSSEASALGSVLSSSANRGASGRCNAVHVEAVQKASDQSAPRRRYRDRFSAEDVLDLRFVVSLPANNPAGLVEIELYTPSGRLYDVLRAEADGEPTDGRSSNRRRRSRTVAAQLPIAGSHITGRSLYGEWEARVYLDGNDEECNRKAFILDP